MNAVADDRADLVQNVFRHPARQIAARVHRNDFADFAGFDFRLCRGITRIETADMAGHEKTFGGISGFDDGFAIGFCRSHRLFQKNVFARFDRSQCRRGVLIPHCGDADRINIGIGQKFVVIGVGFLHAESFGDFFQSLGSARAKRGDFDGLLADARAGRKIGVLLDGLVTAWAELGAGRMTEALAAFDAVTASPGLGAFGLYHKALALASVGDFEGADEILSGRAAGTIERVRRGTVAHVQILSQLERNADAIALLDETFGPQGDPAAEALRARLVAGETLPFDIALSPTDGLAEVFFTLASALNGEATDTYTLVYTRVAGYLRPGHVDAALMTAGLLSAQGQYDLATETYALIPADDPAFHIAEIGLANALEAGGRTDEAIAVLQALAKNESRIVLVQLALGDTLRRAERFAESVPAYDAALALIPVPDRRHWIVFFNRGISHERSGAWPLAEADLRQALVLEPGQPEVLNYLGYSFVDRNENLTEALGMIEQAVAARPDSGYIIDSLAWAYFRQGRYTDAVVPMERASLLEPVDPVVTDHLGDVYWAVGRKLEAQFQWRRALSFEPLEKDATRIRRKLEVGLDVVLAEEGMPAIVPQAEPVPPVADPAAAPAEPDPAPAPAPDGALPPTPTPDDATPAEPAPLTPVPEVTVPETPAPPTDG